MTNDPAMFLVDTGQKTGNVDQCHQRNVEAVAETDEARRLVRRVDVEHAGENLGLLPHDSDTAPLDAREATDDVAREVGVHLGKGTGVDDPADDSMHVV